MMGRMGGYGYPVIDADGHGGEPAKWRSRIPDAFKPQMIEYIRSMKATYTGLPGGGMHISAHDLARFGYLFLRNGEWKGQRIISEDWIRMARTPGVNPGYGFMNWFLNVPAAAADGTDFDWS